MSSDGGMLKRPAFKPHLRVEVVPDDGIVLLSETHHAVLPGRIYALVAPYLDGRGSAESIVASLSDKADSGEVTKILEEMERQGYLTEGCDGASTSEAALWATYGIDPQLASRRLAAASVSVRALGGLSAEPLLTALRSVGIEPGLEGRRRVILTDDYLHPGLEEENRQALEEGREWLLVKPVGCLLWIGPIFVPEKTGCWECLAQRLRGNRDIERFLFERTGRIDSLPLALAFTAATQQIAWNIAASAITTWVVKDETPDLEGALVTLDTRTWASQTHRLIWRPQCSACGDPQDGAEAVARPIELESQRKTFTSDGGHRAMTPEATIERYEQHVSPITGVVSRLERSGLSQDGVMLAYTAGTNIARPPRTLEALRKAGVSMRSTTGGKGVTDVQAKASALCEALERNSGVYRGEEPRRRARFTDLGDTAIHPNACMGFSERQYRERDAWNAQGSQTVAVPVPFDEDAVISWTPVWSLTRGEARYLPTAYCFYGYPVRDESRLCIACSNGNAAGNTLEEAILQGFLELVERDSVALWWYNRLRRPAVALETFDEPYLGKLRAYLAKSGRTLDVLDITSDLGIPTFAAISGRREPPEQITTGFGSHLDPRIAILRAVTELNQLLLVLLRGNAALPADTSGSLHDADPRVAEWIRSAAIADHPYLTADPAQTPRIASDYAGRWSDDLREDVRSCQALVEDRGMEFLVLDQTRPDIGLPVVKVFVPGLRHFWRRLAPGRLYDVPVRLGWLPAPLREEELNPIGIFT